MMKEIELANALAHFRGSLNSYYPLSDEAWLAIQNISRLKYVTKHRNLYEMGSAPSTFSFVHTGLFRSFVSDDKGTQYNKIFFEEGQWPGAISALLKAEASLVTIEALEDSTVLQVDFKAYRLLLEKHHDLALMQIHYLEKNWLLAKDARETAIVLEGASQRYQRFLRDFPALAARLPQYHIASHLGITPTQLSRIRKNT